MPTVTVYVSGKPRPKGSLRHVGGGKLIEEIEDGPVWRMRVSQALATAVARLDTPWEVIKGDHFEVIVDAYFLAPSTGVYRQVPSGRGKGDVDKIARNVLDAMTDSGIILDDSQVTRLIAEKQYAGAEGCAITVRFRPPRAKAFKRRADPPGFRRAQMLQFWQDVRDGKRPPPRTKKLAGGDLAHDVF